MADQGGRHRYSSSVDSSDLLVDQVLPAFRDERGRSTTFLYGGRLTGKASLRPSFTRQISGSSPLVGSIPVITFDSRCMDEDPPRKR
jgi:hypothetical protein